MSKAEKNRVSSGILTDFPDLAADGKVYTYEYGSYEYKFSVVYPGKYNFYKKSEIR